jgi:hypothetical protein
MHQTVTYLCGMTIESHWQLFDHVHLGATPAEMAALKQRIDALGEQLQGHRARRYGMFPIPWR